MRSFKTIFSLSALLLLPLTGCKDEVSFKGKTDEKKTASSQAIPSGNESFTGANKTPLPVDIFFLLDASNSMTSVIEETKRRMDSLINQHLTAKKGLNFQIFIINGDEVPQYSGSSPLVTDVINYIGNHNAIQAFQGIVEGKLDDKISKGLKPRPSSVKELVVVSNDTSGVSHDKFKKWISENRDKVGPEVHVNGIFGIGSRCYLCKSILGVHPCSKTEIGHQYIKMAEDPSMKGVTADICSANSNWDSIFQRLGQQVSTARYPDTLIITLQKKPANGVAGFTINLNGQPLQPTQYTYDPIGNTILFKMQIKDTDKIDVIYK